jgi:hypothetical protein
MKKKPESVATILEREVEPAIKEWLRRANRLPELTPIALHDDDRAAHLPKLFGGLTCRLRLAEDSHLTPSTAAVRHGQERRRQGYSPAMLVEESRLFQVVRFHTLHLQQSELDQGQLMADVMVIADEVDFRRLCKPCAAGKRL